MSTHYVPLTILSFTNISSSNPFPNPTRLKKKLSHVPSSHRWRGVETCYL